MLHCWQEEPDARPKFSELHQQFDRFLGIHIQDHYPYIDIQNQDSTFDHLATEGSEAIEEDDNETIELSDHEDEPENVMRKRSNTFSGVFKL